MNDVKKELLKNYIRSNVAPILTNFVNGINIPNSVLLPANCKMEDLIGHYIEDIYVPPKWMTEIITINAPTILIIDKIDSIPKSEQTKFVEILKYRKVSTFELPKNTVIVVTAKEIDERTINEEIYSLVAYI